MAPLRKSFFVLVDSPLRRRGRPKMTSIDVVTIDMKKCNNLYDDLGHDRLEQRNKIHLADPT